MAKIIKGIFGKKCSDCEGIIPPARLRLQPKTLKCVECQQYDEARKQRGINRALLMARSSDVIIVR